MGQGVSRHLTRLWVLIYHPPRHSPLKLTLNDIIGNTVSLQAQVRK